eukprot:s418_g35.t1
MLVVKWRCRFCVPRRGSLPGVKDSCEISIWKVSCEGTYEEPGETAEPTESESSSMKLWLFSQFNGQIHIGPGSMVMLDSGHGKVFHGIYRAGTAKLAFEKAKVLNIDELLEEMEKKTNALNELGRKRYRLMDELEVVRCQMECIDPTVRVA